jgi:farnesyl diphosphate synthase
MIMLSVDEWKSQTLTAIEHQLESILSLPTKCEQLLTAMRYSSLDGGKRIRPLFSVAAGYLSNAEMATTVTIGSAIELIHCFSLIHDDLPIMDNDDLRRGRPTNHKVFGDAVALLAGDALHALSFEILSSDSLKLDAATKLKIISLLAQSIGVQGMVGGQTIDWLSTGKRLELTQLQEMHLLKTGALLRAAIMAGYLAGSNCNSEQAQDIDLIAHKVGLLFQVVDDIIDVTEDTATLGKTAKKDIDQDKATYVSILGLAEAKTVAHTLHQEVIELINRQPGSWHLKALADSVYYRNY